MVRGRESDEYVKPGYGTARCIWLVSTIIFVSANSLAILAWIWIALSVLAYHGLKTEDAPLFIVPFVYLSLSLFSCFGKAQGIRVARLVLNVPLVLLLVYILVTKFDSIINELKMELRIEKLSS